MRGVGCNENGFIESPAVEDRTVWVLVSRLVVVGPELVVVDVCKLKDTYELRGMTSVLSVIAEASSASGAVEPEISVDVLGYKL